MTNALSAATPSAQPGQSHTAPSAPAGDGESSVRLVIAPVAILLLLSALDQTIVCAKILWSTGRSPKANDLVVTGAAPHILQCSNPLAIAAKRGALP